MELTGLGHENILHHVITEVEVEGMESKWTHSYSDRISRPMENFIFIIKMKNER